MKKLLSLLSVLTIGRGAVPTTIAASPYQKEKTIKNIYINYQQKNNLEKLNRSKRENNQTFEKQKIVIRTNGYVNSAVVLNNKIYVGSSDNNVYEYDPETGEQKIVIRTNYRIYGYAVVLNNKIYVGSSDNNVYEYEYDWKIDLIKSIKNFNLNLINNDNEAILNELNYLNPTLDIT